MERFEKTILDSLLHPVCTQPEFVYEHRWRVGDTVMSDNASTTRQRTGFDRAHRPDMKRTAILPPGERAVPV